jgi:hypothetical protein
MTIEDINKSLRSPVIKGAKIEMGGYAWILPPLTLRQLDDLNDQIRESKGDERKIFEANLHGIAMALQRNYPAVSLEDMLDLVDAGNYKEVLNAMAGISGVALGNASGAGSP